jgi:hypothetical protein
MTQLKEITSNMSSSGRNKSRWEASARIERAKLSNREDDWNLNGKGSCTPPTRTRNGGNGRPNLTKRHWNEPSESKDSEWTSPSLESDESDESVIEPTKPPASRVIVEVESLKSTMEGNCRCKKCYKSVDVSLRTVCLATSIMITCKDVNCGFIYYSDPPAQVAIESPDNRERSTDYAINSLYVLGFLSCGDGCTEAARLLGMLGLPNDTTMESRSFTIIEDRISSKIQDVTKEILKENLTAEVKIAMERSPTNDNNDFELWKESLTNKQVRLSKARYPKVGCSFDMGWQQRSSGNRYNSASGHALLVGEFTRKPIAFTLMSKRCNFCFTWKKKNKDIMDDDMELYMPDHDCTKNHDGTSSAMEPNACLQMVVSLHDDFFVVVHRICADDDASTRSMLRWSNADYMKNNNTNEPPMEPMMRGPNKGKPKVRSDRGKLPANVPETFFVADPNHRRKVLTGELLTLVKSKVADKFTMTKMDATRLGKNFSYMIRQLPRLQEDQYEACGKAVLEHHFDNHEFCGPWCPRKRLAADAPEWLDKERYYRSKSKDALLYKKLEELVARFITLDRLKEVAHGMDTQVNESMNNTFSWLAPKNKLYCGFQSLRNRLSIGIGINALGMEVYFSRLFKMLGIIMTPNVEHFLQVKESKRTKKLNKVKLPATKKERLKVKYEQLREDTAMAVKCTMLKAVLVLVRM